MQISVESSKNDTIIYALTSVVICLAFGFVDEGNYSFQWMTNIGNWIALSVYGFSIFSFQLLAANFLFKPVALENGKRLISVLTGTTFGFLFVVLFIF